LNSSTEFFRDSGFEANYLKGLELLTEELFAKQDAIIIENQEDKTSKIKEYSRKYQKVLIILENSDVIDLENKIKPKDVDIVFTSNTPSSFYLKAIKGWVKQNN